MNKLLTKYECQHCYPQLHVLRCAMQPMILAVHRQPCTRVARLLAQEDVVEHPKTPPKDLLVRSTAKPKEEPLEEFTYAEVANVSAVPLASPS
eukprot:4794411-Amphidinium_carterae.1